MKQIFFIAPMLLLLSWEKDYFPKTEMASNVYASTGSRGADCRGTGICSIQSSDNQTPSAAIYEATMGLDAEGKIFLEFNYTDIPADVTASQFANNVFVMESDCPVPTEVLRAIQANDTLLTLRTGAYPLIKSSQAVRIIFN
ncbi:MAG: hypothetical protein ACKVU0_18755 [Saprospiraceae bacterium]